jgi:hypothetical protein
MGRVMLRRCAIAVWAIILLVLAVRPVVAARSNSVYPIFSAAGRHWIDGESVYPPPTPDLDVFRYSPAVAAFFAPWSMLDDRIAGIAWRLLNAAVFLSGLAVWCRFHRPQLSAAAAALLVVPLAVGGLNNGQCNALMAGMLLLAHTLLTRGRWTVAAVLVTIPVLLKGYPLALGLLFFLVEPKRFAPRLVLCLLIAAALPYFFQRPEFVTEQYAAYFDRLRTDDRSALALDASYRDLHMLVRLANVAMDLRGYRLLEVGLGLAAGMIVVAGLLRGWKRETALAACFAVGSCWMTLAGPATESSTYVLIAPVLAAAVLTANSRPPWQRHVVTMSSVLFAAAAVAVWFPGHVARPFLAIGVQPIAALLLTVHVVTKSLRNENGRPRDGGRPSPIRVVAHFFSTFGKSASSSRTAA